jgi:hypothetical protein
MTNRRACLAAALPIWTRAHAALEAELGDPARLRRELLFLSAPHPGASAPALCDGQEARA